MSAQPMYAPYGRHGRIPDEKPSLSVVRGAGSQKEAVLSPTIILLAKAVAVLLVVIAALAFVRVTLASATVATAVETQQLSSQINNARSEGSYLEVDQSELANPTRIRTMAAEMGMISPESVTYINLNAGQEWLVTDSQGNLSLSGSLSALRSL